MASRDIVLEDRLESFSVQLREISKLAGKLVVLIISNPSLPVVVIPSNSWIVKLLIIALPLSTIKTFLSQIKKLKF